MKNHQAGILSLRDRVEAERKATDNRITFFSEEIKREVVAFLNKCKSQSEAARRVGITQSTISRWVREGTASIVPPRKLMIVEPPELEIVVPIPHIERHFDAVLPNGIVLKGLSLNACSLALLRGAL